jgi:hypothetical protein
MTTSQFQETVAEVMGDDERRFRFGADGRPGRKWVKNFFDRNPSLTHRSASKMTVGMASVSENNIRRWHHMAKLEIEQVDGAATILADPRRIFNVDESGFPLDAGK